MAWHRLRWCYRMLKSKTGRMVIMLLLTIVVAVVKIAYGIAHRSQLLMADGLFSFAEGVALVGSLIALRYAKTERLHSKNTFGWARLEILAGLLQEVFLVALSFSIIVDAVNKLINPNPVESATSVIYLGSVGIVIGLLGIIFFRGYHHDHNIGHEIVEQKKNDFVRSVYTTLRSLDMSNENTPDQFMRQTSISSPQSIVIPELVVTESTSNNYSNNVEQKTQKRQDSILPSLNATYKNAYVASDPTHTITEERISDGGEQQLRVPDRVSVEFKRMRSTSGDSIVSSTSFLDHDDSVLHDEFQKSRVYATLHAICLHSMAVLLESSIVLFSGILTEVLGKGTDNIKEQTWLQYVDPSLTIVMVIIISIKALPVIWSLGHILVEAVPSGIDTRQLIQTIMKTVPQIRAVHSVHVWRATARDVFATLHVVCDEDLSLTACTDIFGRQLQRIFDTHCIRHFTVQFEYVEPGGNINKCSYGTRRRHRGHQSTSEDNDNVTRHSQTDLRFNPFKKDFTEALRRSV